MIPRPRRLEPIPPRARGARLGDYEESCARSAAAAWGASYLARRADEAFQKHVAIKILSTDSGSDIGHRFQREREILAQLDHPNIARLLDAGETPDGLPYFVMEYVEGHSITQYARRTPAHGGAAVGELFRQVCDAVEYAHQRKIVHRDLKPSNVLVTNDGQAKLLDFGIARLTENDTAAAELTARPVCG